MKYPDAAQLKYETRKYGLPRGLDFGTGMADNVQKLDLAKMRQYRMERAKAQMARDGLGAMLLYEPWNIRYTTGFNVLIYTRAEPRFYALLPRNGDPYLWGMGMVHEVYREEMPWLKGNVRLCKQPVGWMTTDAKKDFVGAYENEIAEILKQHGVQNEPLGVDSLAGGSIFALQQAFQRVGIQLVDGRNTMLEARKIKCQEEIELMRIAHSIAEAAHADIRDAIRPGVTECELAGVAAKRCLSMGAEWLEGFVVASGPNTNPNRRGWSDRIIRAGDMVFVDIIGSQYLGYRTCIYRTFTCGKATQEQKEMYQAAYEMLYAAMKKIKAGATFLEIVNEWPEPEHWGYTREEENMVWENALCHGVGLSQYDLPHINKQIARANPAAKLEENMVMAVEIWEGKRGGIQGCRLEEMVAVKEGGYDLISQFPIKELIECWI
jgi:Xaa-Pro aminopeptidase